MLFKKITYPAIILILTSVLILFVLNTHNDQLRNNEISQPVDSNSITEGSITVSDSDELHYWFYDRHTPTVTVFLHGGPGGNSLVARKIFGDILADSIGSVLFYDQRGGGQSIIKDFGNLNFKEASNDLYALISKLAPDKKIIIIGNSHGGLIAAFFNHYYPGIAKAFVLVVPGHFSEKARRTEASTLDDKLAETYRTEHLIVNELLASKNISTELEEDRPLVRSAWDANESLGQLEALSILSELENTPTLVISGEYDFVVRPSEIEAIKKTLPSASYYQIAGAGHSLFLLKTDEVISAIKHFLAP